MAPLARAVLATGSVVLGLLPVGMLFSSAPPTGTGASALALGSGLAAFGAALVWMFAMPTRTMSVVYAVVSTLSITAAILAQSDPDIALLACTVFATASGYIALFHTPVLMCLNLLLVVFVPIVPTAVLARTHGIVYAVCGYGAVLVVNVAVPFGIQIIVQALGTDLVKADRDSLTGLLNRRAFYEQVILMAAAQPADTHLVMAMVDLDRFKRLNDTHGHVFNTAVGGAADTAMYAAKRNGGNQSRHVADLVGETPET
jgi:hypothetical protein